MTTIGVDIGGTKIEAGRVKGRKIVESHLVPTDAKKGKKAVLQHIIKAIEHVWNSDVASIGIGHPGPLDLKKGLIGNAINLPLHGVYLCDIIQKHFNVPVRLDNDANCFTLGETLFGKGKGKKTVLGITLGTGVGSGLVINGSIYHGRNNALELGHTTIKFDGRKAKCGNAGCLERYVGTVGLAQSAREAGLKASDGKILFDLALAGNAKAKRIFQDYGTYLGVGLANFIDIFDPDVIIIGGNLTKSWDMYGKRALNEMKRRTFFSPCPVVRSTLPSASILGAASLS
ncbi:MAG: ROK family protein [Nanoarchaeota archaeon]